MDKKILIQIKNVTKKFKSETVLDDVSLNLTDNHIYGFIGRNGSGKTVLFKMICGYLLADRGQITVNGKVIGKDVGFPENLGALIENPGFIWYQSGFANLWYLARIQNKIDKEKVRAAMQSVGLDPDSKKWVGKYSLGMKQRLGIAQAIMEEPDILILDEPMNGLDEKGVEDMRRLLLEYRAPGRIILLTSHNREDIEMLCDEVFSMRDGKIENVIYKKGH